MDMPEKNDITILYKTVKTSGRLAISLGILGILCSVILEFVPSTEMFYGLSLFLLKVLFGFPSIVVGILSFIVENMKNDKHKKVVSIISLVVTIITIIFFILLFIDLL